MKQLILVIALAALNASAGNEGRGTEDSVIIGEYLYDRLSPEDLKFFDLRVQTISEVVTDRRAITQVANLFRKGNPKFFNTPRGVPSPKDLFLELRDLKVAEALENSKFYLSEKCVDKKGEERTAVTDPAPGSDVCVNPRRVALLELALNDFSPKNLRDFRVLNGVIAHEGARQFDRDDNHKFLLGMIPESDETQFIAMEDKGTETNLTLGKAFLLVERDHKGDRYSNQGREFGFDFKKSGEFSIRVAISEDAPAKCLSDLRVYGTKHAGVVDHYLGNLPFVWSKNKLILNPGKRSGVFSNSETIADAFDSFPDKKAWNETDYDNDVLSFYPDHPSEFKRDCESKVTVEVYNQKNDLVSSDLMRAPPICQTERCWSGSLSLKFWNLKKFGIDR